MPRTKEQNERMRQATREKIQAAAAELFAKKGLTGTNVQEIADLSEISIGLLYRHYKTKDALFAEMVEFALEGLKKITELFETEGSPKELLMQIAAEVHYDLVTNGEFVNLLILLTQAFLSGSTTGGVERLAQQDARMLDATSKLIERGQLLGEFRQGNPKEMSSMFFSTIQGLGIMKGVLGDQLSIPTLEMMTAHLFTERID